MLSFHVDIHFWIKWKTVWAAENEGPRWKKLRVRNVWCVFTLSLFIVQTCPEASLVFHSPSVVAVEAVLSWDGRWETCPTDFQLISDELTEPRSSGSHFYLCFLPRLILISQCSPTPPPPSPPLPREAGVQWPRSVHARPPWHASSSPLRSPSTQKLHGITDKYPYIVHNTGLPSWVPH